MTACQKSLFDKLVDGGVNYPQFGIDPDAYEGNPSVG
nr:MAG TPA: hypothetical protein [Caudoviricetes sp.]